MAISYLVHLVERNIAVLSESSASGGGGDDDEHGVDVDVVDSSSNDCYYYSHSHYRKNRSGRHPQRDYLPNSDSELIREAYVYGARVKYTELS